MRFKEARYVLTVQQIATNVRAVQQIATNVRDRRKKSL
jgi:hypothetical protein